MIVWESERKEPIAYKVAVAGDFLPGGGLIPRQGRSWSDMAKEVSSCFSDVAISFINLEGPLGTVQPSQPLGLGGNLCGAPEALGYLEPLRVSVIGFANNHIYDYGRDGLLLTKEIVQRHGMTGIGAGRTLKEVPETHVWKGPEEVRVGLWAAANVTSHPATRKRAGTEVATQKRAWEALREMRSQGATFTIALLYAGLEHTNYPDPSDLAVMHGIADTGFDLVAACHSHRMSGYTMRYGKEGGRPSFCFFGLGSLSSGVVYSSLEREGLVVVAGLNRKGSLERIETRPIFLDETGWGTAPDKETEEHLLKRFVRLSQEISQGSYARLFYKDASRGLIRRHCTDALVAFRAGGLSDVAQKFSRLRIKHIHRFLHSIRM